jgi:plastocyanin
MRSISSRRFAEAVRGRFRTVTGIILLATLALMGGRQVFAKESPATHVVVMENMKFSPSVLRVHVGDKIEFKNSDLVPHTATAKPAGAFDSGPVMPGQSWVFSPKKTGTFEYACTFHPVMTGSFTVEGE